MGGNLDGFGLDSRATTEAEFDPQRILCFTCVASSVLLFRTLFLKRRSKGTSGSVSPRSNT